MAHKKTQAYTEEFRREAVKRSENEGILQTTTSVLLRLKKWQQWLHS